MLHLVFFAHMLRWSTLLSTDVINSAQDEAWSLSKKISLKSIFESIFKRKQPEGIPSFPFFLNIFDINVDLRQSWFDSSKALVKTCHILLAKMIHLVWKKMETIKTNPIRQIIEEIKYLESKRQMWLGYPALMIIWTLFPSNQGQENFPLACPLPQDQLQR